MIDFVLQFLSNIWWVLSQVSIGMLLITFYFKCKNNLNYLKHDISKNLKDFDYAFKGDGAYKDTPNKIEIHYSLKSTQERVMRHPIYYAIKLGIFSLLDLSVCRIGDYRHDLGPIARCARGVPDHFRDIEI